MPRNENDYRINKILFFFYLPREIVQSMFDEHVEVLSLIVKHDMDFEQNLNPSLNGNQ